LKIFYPPRIFLCAEHESAVIFDPIILEYGQKWLTAQLSKTFNKVSNKMLGKIAFEMPKKSIANHLKVIDIKSTTLKLEN
jgi:hypothetical protein